LEPPEVEREFAPLLPWGVVIEGKGTGKRTALSKGSTHCRQPALPELKMSRYLTGRFTLGNSIINPGSCHGSGAKKRFTAFYPSA